jgi:hypothetical protein
MIGRMMKTRVPTRILGILLKTNLSSSSQDPGINQSLIHPKPRKVTALRVKAIRKELATVILTLLISSFNVKTEGGITTPQVGINLIGFRQNKPMGLGLRRKSSSVNRDMFTTVYPQLWQTN